MRPEVYWQLFRNCQKRPKETHSVVQLCESEAARSGGLGSAGPDEVAGDGDVTGSTVVRRRCPHWQSSTDFSHPGHRVVEEEDENRCVGRG